MKTLLITISAAAITAVALRNGIGHWHLLNDTELAAMRALVATPTPAAMLAAAPTATPTATPTPGPGAWMRDPRRRTPLDRGAFNNSSRNW